MQADLTLILITIAIAALLLLILALLFASIVRRVCNDRKYRKLDTLRQTYERLLLQAPGQDGSAVQDAFFAAKPGSLAWQAIEDVLFKTASEGRFSEQGRAMFQRLGYAASYEERLAARNIIDKAAAIDKLGRMGGAAAAPKLIPLLDDAEPEVLSVTVRALSRIGTKEALEAILGRLPRLLGESLVTRKAMETALLNFGKTAIPALTRYRGGNADPWIVSCVLETLSRLDPDAAALSLAEEHLRSQNAEVRSKALKVLRRAGWNVPPSLAGAVTPLLGDTVWFVRLQAAKAAGALALESAAPQLGKLLFDKHWQVRRQAALALTRLDRCAIDIFIEALSTPDRYARESVCEQIERAGFCGRLIANLTSGDEHLRTRSRDILKTMQDMQFSTPLTAYLADGNDERIKQEILRFRTEEQVS